MNDLPRRYEFAPRITNIFHADSVLSQKRASVSQTRLQAKSILQKPVVLNLISRRIVTTVSHTDPLERRAEYKNPSRINPLELYVQFSSPYHVPRTNRFENFSKSFGYRIFCENIYKYK